MRLVSAALFGLAALACKNGEPQRERAEPAGAFVAAREAEVYFSTEVGGYVEPCGCTTAPLGGLPRLASVITQSKRERVLVDAGNLLFPAALDDAGREQHVLKARVLARVYRQLGAAALNVAENDLLGGAELLREIQREGAFPLVSANVRPAEGGPAIARSFMRVVGGIRLGFTGVSTPERMPKDPLVTAIEYAPALKAELAGLRKNGAELVFVLAHLGDAGARELARIVPDIDVIVRAPGTPIEAEPAAPVVVGQTVIVEAGSQGQHVGRLILRAGPRPLERPLALDDGSIKEARRRAQLERKIRAYRMDLEAWGVDPARAEAVQMRQGQVQQLERERDAAPPPPVPLATPHMKLELVSLSGAVEAHPETAQALAGYYARLRELNADKGDLRRCAPPEKQARYVGSAKCEPCHGEAYAFWKKTKHARAWATLEEQNKHYDLTCVGCHVIGWQEPGGVCRIRDVGALKDVGCESCHGPGSTHVDDEEASSIRLAAPEATCRGFCHVPEHSDGFVYAKYLREITGPGHVLKSAP